MRPPSQAFQLRVIVRAIASAISTTSSGVPNRRQVVFSGLLVGSICGRGAATIEPVAISSLLRTNAIAKGKYRSRARSTKARDEFIADDGAMFLSNHRCTHAMFRIAQTTADGMWTLTFVQGCLAITDGHAVCRWHA